MGGANLGLAWLSQGGGFILQAFQLPMLRLLGRLDQIIHHANAHRHLAVSQYCQLCCLSCVSRLVDRKKKAIMNTEFSVFSFL